MIRITGEAGCRAWESSKLLSETAFGNYWPLSSQTGAYRNITMFSSKFCLIPAGKGTEYPLAILHAQFNNYVVRGRMILLRCW